MSDTAFGANVTRLFDPKKNTHYALSEDGQFELKQLFGALAALGYILDTPPGAEASEIQQELIAPLFFSFARHGERIMSEMAVQYPSKFERGAA